MKNIALKMVKVMHECSYVQKNGFNAFNKYKYASAADILEKVNESLVKNNVASFVSPKLIEFKDVVTNTGKAEHLATVEVSILLVDGDSGESITVTGLGSGQDNGDKGVMKAQTAAIKYAWMMSLNISTGDDPEADTSVDERNNAKPIQTPVQQNKTQPQATQAVAALINEDQRKQLSVIAKELGLSGEDMKQILNFKYKKSNSKELTELQGKYLIENLDGLWKSFIESQSKAG